MIVEKILDYRKNKAKVWPCHANRASDIGHPCLRYLVYSRTHWDQRLLPDPGLLSVFEEGNIHENAVIRLLQDAGFTILEQQRPYTWDEYKITGHIDGKILINDKTYPFDVKSMAQHTWDQINTIDDMANSKHWYMRKYPWQLMAYLLMGNQEEGLFLCKNKTTGFLKEIWMSIDYEMGEEIIRKAEEINRCVEQKTMPDPMIDEEACPHCDFRHICLPAMTRCSEIELSNDPKLISMLDRLEVLKPSHKEYETLDKELKSMIKGKEKLSVGDWLIEGKLIQRAGFTAKPSEYMKYSIVRLAN